MTPSPSLEHQMDLVEQQFNEVSAALLSGDALALEAASAALQQASITLIQIRNNRAGALAPSLALRIQALWASFALVRDALHRRSALVDRSLQVVVPSMEKSSTYAGDSTPYGSATRKSGMFRVAAA